MSRMGLLVCLDHVLTVLEVGEWLPCCIMERVSLPFHEVLNARAMMSFLQDGFHFVLRFTIDDEGRREVVRAPRRVEGGGVDVGEELAHMEDVMNLHVGGEFKSASGWGGSLDDLEGANEPGLELGAWVDVLEVEVVGR
jgi:hypothetical protein